MWNAPSKNGPTYPHSNGDLSQGSIMAFKVTQQDRAFSLEPAWVSGVAQIPDSPITAGGVVFALATGEQTVSRTPSHASFLTWSLCQRFATRRLGPRFCTPSSPRRASFLLKWRPAHELDPLYWSRWSRTAR